MQARPDFQPLYKQVYAVLVRRIADSEWQPGDSLPSEQVLALELGVSQGTVRKALDALAAEKLVQRRQGKGTFVAEHTQEHALFRFFRIARPHPDGERVIPESGSDRVRRRTATAIERSKLSLRKGALIVEIKRTRLIDHVPAITEKSYCRWNCFRKSIIRIPCQIHCIHCTRVCTELASPPPMKS